MKRYILQSTEYNIDPVEIEIHKIKSITLVGDIYSANPRDYAVYSSTDLPKGKLDYSTLTREQLLQLPKRELEHIHDVRILRKLKKSELTIQQQRDIIQDSDKNFQSSINQVKGALQKLKECPCLYVWQTTKNNDFTQEIADLGGRLRDEDVENMVQELHVKDYSYSTYSYVDSDWNCLLMVFEYRKPYTFRPKVKGQPSVTVDSMDVYVKIDVESATGDGYSVMSFHRPQGKMVHPYKDYPVDKE